MIKSFLTHFIFVGQKKVFLGSDLAREPLVATPRSKLTTSKNFFQGEWKKEKSSRQKKKTTRKI